MTKQEAIAEMAVIGCVRTPKTYTAKECAKCNFKKGQCNAYRHAEALYNAGYRKIFTSDLANDITKERNEIKDIMKLLDKCVSLNPMCKSEVASVLYGNNYRKAEEVRKETAEKILNELIDSSNKITFFDCRMALGLDKLAEQYGVEVEE